MWLCLCVVRPTEVLENDVFVCESKYNEAIKSIRKHKGLKVSERLLIYTLSWSKSWQGFPLKDSVMLNEIYYLPEELHLWKVRVSFYILNIILNAFSPVSVTPPNSSLPLQSELLLLLLLLLNKLPLLQARLSHPPLYRPRPQLQQLLRW